MTRVLVVDDEPSVLRALRINLTARNYQASTASDGASGIAVMARERPDVMILDLGLPAMAVTAGVFLAARISVQTLRGHLFTPLRSVHALVSPTGAVSLGTPLVGPQNWVLDSNVVDRSGHVVSDQTVLPNLPSYSQPPRNSPVPSASPPTSTTSSTSTSRSAATGPFKASNSASSPPSQSACSRLPSGPSPKPAALGGGWPPCAPSARPPSGLQRKLRPPFHDLKTRPRPGQRVLPHP